MAEKAAATPKTRTLLVKRLKNMGYDTRAEEFKITVPATAKVTMSQGLNPAGNAKGYTGSAPCLRIYEGTKQTACFVNISEFRDLSYEIEEKIVKYEEENEAKGDSRGNKEQKGRRVIAESWEKPEF